jgi:branched-chain amino acid transport system ATP-binding protein
MSRAGVLAVENATKRFGGIVAVEDVSLTLAQGDLLGLIGPNGAGKTTLLSMISGVAQPTSGRVFLGGRDVTALGADDRARLGLALTHQVVRPFRSMTALENVTLAAGHRHTASVIKAFLAVNRAADQTRASALLALLRIADYRDSLPSAMPLGALKRLEMARALALGPKILLLDEPLAGLNHIEAERLAETIASINRQGVTIVLIEHNLREVLRVCRRLLVLDNGRRIAEGDPATVIRDPAVQTAYLGREAAHATA